MQPTANASRYYVGKGNLEIEVQSRERFNVIQTNLKKIILPQIIHFRFLLSLKFVENLS